MRKFAFTQSEVSPARQAAITFADMLANVDFEARQGTPRARCAEGLYAEVIERFTALEEVHAKLEELGETWGIKDPSLENIEEKLDELRDERDKFEEERDEFEKDAKGLRCEKAELETEGDNLRKERDQLHNDLDAANRALSAFVVTGERFVAVARRKPARFSSRFPRATSRKAPRLLRRAA